MRVNVIVGVMASVFVCCLGAGVMRADQGQAKPGPSKPDEDQSQNDESRIQTGLRYAKDQGITLDLKGRNRASVGLGSYLVNAGRRLQRLPHRAPVFGRSVRRRRGAETASTSPATWRAARRSARSCPATSRRGKTANRPG